MSSDELEFYLSILPNDINENKLLKYNDFLKKIKLLKHEQD